MEVRKDDNLVRERKVSSLLPNHASLLSGSPPSRPQLFPSAVVLSAALLGVLTAPLQVFFPAVAVSLKAAGAAMGKLARLPVSVARVAHRSQRTLRKKHFFKYATKVNNFRANGSNKSTEQSGFRTRDEYRGTENIESNIRHVLPPTTVHAGLSPRPKPESG